MIMVRKEGQDGGKRCVGIIPEGRQELGAGEGEWRVEITRDRQERDQSERESEGEGHGRNKGDKVH